MPAYTPLQSIQLTEATSSVTFSGIPQTYQDLVLSVSAIGSTAGADIRVQLNSDTGSNYSITRLVAYTTVFSNRASNATYFQPTNSVGIGTTEFTASNFNFINYSNTTTNKTMLVRHNQPQGSLLETAAHAGLWRNTAAITSITFTLSSGSYAAGSTFDLYGLSPVAAQTAQAFGGTDIYYDSSYVYHVFKGSGTFTPYRNLTCDYLVVAGGGSGGVSGGGGGGAGGVRSTVTWTGGRSQGSNLESALSLTANTNYTVTIGAGGAGGFASNYSIRTNGSDSIFSTITSTGGGAGGNRAASSFTGNNGGYGGGGGTETGANTNTQAGGTGTTGQGFGGGSGTTNNQNGVSGGGGGGASAAGSNGSFSTNVGTGGAGGAGIWTALTNATGIGQLSEGNYYIGGGGGGAGYAIGGGTATAGAAGLGGGGAGTATTGSGTAAAPGSGATNTGAGGGASSGDSNSGGSGLVIIRYVR